MGNVFKIDVTLEGKNKARLQAKKYEKDYTDIPNIALPKTLRESLENVFKNLTNQELPENDFTFMVRSDKGAFKRVFSPAVYRNPETNELVIKWGNGVIPLTLQEGKIVAPLSSNKKLKLKFTSEAFGKYKKTCVVASYSDNGDLYSMPFPIRALSLEDELDVNELEILLEDDPGSIPPRISELTTKSADDGEYKGSSSKLDGEFLVKVSALPVGEYSVTGFRRYENNYGTQHILQVEPVSESFLATTRVKDENDTWGDSEVSVGDSRFLVKANTRLNRLLMSDPIVSEEFPAILCVTEKGEYNGNPTAKVTFEPQSYTLDDELFSVNF